MSSIQLGTHPSRVVSNIVISGMIFFIATLLTPNKVQAELRDKPSIEQLRSDSRIFMKKVHLAQLSHYAQQARFAPSLTDLGIKVPFYLSKYYSVADKLLSKSGYDLRLRGIARENRGELYLINQTGQILGMDQFENAAELNREIEQVLLSFYLSEKAYFAEWGQYSDDLKQLGLVVPPYFSKFGAFSIKLTQSGFVAEFIGQRYPIANLKYSIDEAKVISAP
jgi:hypothetical protein